MMSTRAWAQSVFTINMAPFVLANVLWYWIKLINSSHGRSVSIWRHHGDIRYFTQVLREETDLQRRRKYKTILWTLRISIVVAVLLVVLGGILVWISEASSRTGR